ncbi:MAG: leucine-rich repeat domain-containing protein [Candidatus Hydrogenedentes bacterium]|nr:leucine-rich repeat domain-containing protein [Candidatus Hydrogenedentota bacterium]
MWRTFALVCVTGAALAGLSGCPSIFSGIVYFPDAALESAVRASIGKPLGLLTRDDLLDAREIQASALNIRNLEGLQYCRFLQTLDLRTNLVQSITPLEGLVNLRRLDLGDNEVTNIEALAGLFFLEEVILFGDGNEIINWSPLAANSRAGGLGDGDILNLPVKTTLDEEGNVLDYWFEDYQALLDAGVVLIFSEPDTGAN